MQNPFIPHRLVWTLVIGALVLPIVLSVIIGVSALLSMMGDSLGGCVLQRIALAGGILWTIDLICLVLAIAVGSLRGPDEPK